MGYQIVDGLPDMGGVSGRVPIWPQLPSDSTDINESPKWNSSLLDIYVLPNVEK